MNGAWFRIQNVLENSLHKGTFKVWIQPLSGELKGKTLILRAPNNFVSEWIKDRLTREIIEAASSILGFVPELDIQAGEVTKKNPAPEPKIRKKEYRPGLPLAPNLGLDKRFKFDFEKFVVGPSNELAYVASKSVCGRELTADQLFLCSSPGLGKTHLIHSIGSLVCRDGGNRKIRVAYLSAEEFANQMIFALKNRRIEEFKNKFRDSIDMLLLEDIHFFQGKEKIQDEFLATVDALKNQGKKIAMSSTFLPKELKDMDSHLMSRLNQGFLAVIDKPDFQTRLRILENKSTAMQIPVSSNVKELLADKIHSDVRQLESCLQNLILKARLMKEEISLDLAWQILQNYDVRGPKLDMEKIVNFVCSAYGLNISDLSSKSRKKQNVLARNTAFYLARLHTDMSLKEIGRNFNRRHSTVLKGISNLEREMSRKTPLGRQVKQTISHLEC
ncbi:MAG: chromosomal replication initiator protein DnaA [Desulfovibrionales bacterium]